MVQDSPSDISLVWSSFRGNRADQTGGAVGAVTFDNANFTELSFAGNSVSGGALSPCPCLAALYF